MPGEGFTIFAKEDLVLPTCYKLFLDKVTSSVVAGHCVDIVFLDLAKAFNDNTTRQTTIYPRRSRSAIGVDTVFTLDVCLYVCMLAL